MINIFEDLQSLNIKVYQEGEAPKTLPDEYFTYNEDATSDLVNADNKTKAILWEFTLKFYTNSTEPMRVYNGLNEAIQLLKSKGYIIDGVGYKNPSYLSWYSRQVDVSKIEYIGG